MPWYTFRGPVRVVDDDEDVEVDDEERLRTIDGLTYDDEMLADRLDDSNIEDADVEGGTIELRWVEDRLEVRTAFEVAGSLEPPELDALKAFTLSQWESGIGETVVADYLSKTGLRLELAPEGESGVEVEIEDS